MYSVWARRKVSQNQLATACWPKPPKQQVQESQSLFYVKKKNTCHTWVEQNMSRNMQQNEADVHTHLGRVRINVTAEKNITYHAETCVRGTWSCSQERTLPCLLFVCVWRNFDTHLSTSWTKDGFSSLIWHWFALFFMLSRNRRVHEYSC